MLLEEISQGQKLLQAQGLRRMVQILVVPLGGAVSCPFGGFLPLCILCLFYWHVQDVVGGEVKNKVLIFQKVSKVIIG